MEMREMKVVMVVVERMLVMMIEAKTIMKEVAGEQQEVIDSPETIEEIEEIEEEEEEVGEVEEAGTEVEVVVITEEDMTEMRMTK